MVVAIPLLSLHLSSICVARLILACTQGVKTLMLQVRHIVRITEKETRKLRNKLNGYRLRTLQVH
jgi:hypothetical protein